MRSHIILTSSFLRHHTLAMKTSGRCGNGRLREPLFCSTRLSLVFARRGSRGLHSIPTLFGFFACITLPRQPQLISALSRTCRRDV